MPLVLCDKHIKSSSQENAFLLAAVVSTQCQQVPEDKTMAVIREAGSTTATTARKQRITSAATRKQEVEDESE